MADSLIITAALVLGRKDTYSGSCAEDNEIEDEDQLVGDRNT